MNALLRLLSGSLLGLVSVASSSAALDEVRLADVAFAERATEAGYHLAFVEYLADDAVLFRPEAVGGQQWLAANDPAPGRLEWRPSAAAAACSGRLAVTSGPWRYTNDEGGESAEGHYLSVWRLEEDGQWRVILDHGIDHAPGSAPAAPLESSFGRLWPARESAACTGRADQADLVRAENDLNDRIARLGLPEALGRAAAEGALAYRDESAPGLLAELPPQGDANFGPGSVARSVGVVFDVAGDMAVTHGIMQAVVPTRRALYLRVWQRERRKWQVAIDLQTPLPAQLGL
jgi:ketosteroid isomerase-like protein